MRSRWRSPDRGRHVSGTAFVAAAALVALAGALCARGAAAADADPRFAEGRAIFLGGTTPACALCHTLKEAGATGAVGPVLDDVRPDEARVAAAVRGGVGAMPSFAGTLSDAQIRAVAHYVAKASGGAP
jgi:sulfite dehydrogenase